ncbi:MAG: DUF493 domain-containing protein [Porticoccaceae bacterium]
MNDSDPPRIEFPCDYPIKVLGDSGESFRSHVISVFELHAPGFDETRITMRDSSGGKFQALTITITATGEPQLQALFEDLKGSSLVKMVL